MVDRIQLLNISQIKPSTYNQVEEHPLRVPSLSKEVPSSTSIASPKSAYTAVATKTSSEVGFLTRTWNSVKEIFSLAPAPSPSKSSVRLGQPVSHPHHRLHHHLEVPEHAFNHQIHNVSLLISLMLQRTMEFSQSELKEDTKALGTNYENKKVASKTYHAKIQETLSKLEATSGGKIYKETSSALTGAFALASSYAIGQGVGKLNTPYFRGNANYAPLITSLLVASCGLFSTVTSGINLLGSSDSNSPSSASGSSWSSWIGTSLKTVADKVNSITSLVPWSPNSAPLSGLGNGPLISGVAKGVETAVHQSHNSEREAFTTEYKTLQDKWNSEMKELSHEMGYLNEVLQELREIEDGFLKQARETGLTITKKG